MICFKNKSYGFFVIKICLLVRLFLFTDYSKESCFLVHPALQRKEQNC